MNSIMENYVKIKYKAAKNNFSKIMADVQLKCVSTVISKGVLYNVLPYENELNGDKVKGKKIAEPICKNDCYRYSFDEQGRIILVEEMSEFLGHFHYATMYFYHDDMIETMYWDADTLYNFTVYLLGENGPIEVYFCSDKSEVYKKYYYENACLMKIASKTKRDTIEIGIDFNFFYKSNGILQKIIRSWDSGGTEVVYTTDKINYKRLEQRLLNEMEKSILGFTEQNSDKKITLMAFMCYPGHGYLSLSADTCDCVDKDSPADWEYVDFASSNLVDIPLDDKEEEKVLTTIAKVADAITKLTVFSKLSKADGFYCTMFNHDEEYIEQTNIKLKKLLRDNPYFIHSK
ncbi:hypothetical protein UT300005_14260 [Clostridium sp. CTA-5]